jgi:hypothetical protein
MTDSTQTRAVTEVAAGVSINSGEGGTLRKAFHNSSRSRCLRH